MTADSLDTVADYISKIAYEVTSPSTKDGRFGNRAPFAILRDALATGLADDCELWLEWEQASHGHKQLTWSVGVREWAGLSRERSDEEIVSEDLHGEQVIALTGQAWEAIRDTDDVTELLDTAEDGGAEGAIAWLERRRLTYVLLSPTDTG